MALVDDILIGLGLDTTDFIAEIKKLGDAYEGLLKKFTTPIEFNLSTTSIDAVREKFNQLNEVTTNFAENISKKFNLNEVLGGNFLERATAKVKELQSKLSNIKLRIDLESNLSDFVVKLDEIRSANVRNKVTALTSEQKQILKDMFNKFSQDLSTVFGKEVTDKIFAGNLNQKVRETSKVLLELDESVKSLGGQKSLDKLQRDVLELNDAIRLVSQNTGQLDALKGVIQSLSNTKGVPAEAISSLQKFFEFVRTSRTEGTAESANLLEQKKQLLTAELQAVAANEKAKTDVARVGASERTKVLETEIGKQLKITEDGSETLVQLVRKAGLRFSGEGFGEGFEALGRSFETVSNEIETRLANALKVVSIDLKELASLNLPPSHPLNPQNVLRNIELQQKNKEAITILIAEAKKLAEIKDELDITPTVDEENVTKLKKTLEIQQEEFNRASGNFLELNRLATQSNNNLVKALEKRQIQQEKLIKLTDVERQKVLQLQETIARRANAEAAQVADTLLNVRGLPTEQLTKNFEAQTTALKALAERSAQQRLEVERNFNLLIEELGGQRNQIQIRLLRNNLANSINILKQAETEVVNFSKKLGTEIEKALVQSADELAKLRSNVSKQVVQREEEVAAALLTVEREQNNLRILEEQKANQKIIEFQRQLVTATENVYKARLDAAVATLNQLSALEQAKTKESADLLLKTLPSAAVTGTTDADAELQKLQASQTERLTFIRKLAEAEQQKVESTARLEETTRVQQERLELQSLQKTGDAESLKQRKVSDEEIQLLNQEQRKREENAALIEQRLVKIRTLLEEISATGGNVSKNVLEGFKQQEAVLVDAAQAAEKAANDLRKDRIETFDDDTKVAENRAKEQERIQKQTQARRIKLIQQTEGKIAEIQEQQTATILKIEEEKIARDKIIAERGSREKITIAEKIIKAQQTVHAALEKLEQGHQRRLQQIRSGKFGIREEARSNVELQFLNRDLTAAVANARLFGREQDKISERGGAINRIFSGFSKNIFESVGQVIKFNAAWRLTGGIIEAAFFPFTAFIDSIRDGFNFLVNLQEKVTDIQEVLVQNVIFSKDLAENFILAGEAAQNLALQQERAAALIGVETDKFRQVFEAATQTGLFKAIENSARNTEESFTAATRSVSLMIAALNSVGVSTRDLRRQTTEIGKLLEGQVTQRDRIRIASGLTVDELNKQSLEMQKQGKFLEFLEGLFGAQAERIATANNRFKELSTQLDFFRRRLQAALVQPVFERLIKFFQQLLKLIQDNEKELLKFARNAGFAFEQLFLVFVELAKTLREILTGSDSFVEVLKDINGEGERFSVLRTLFEGFVTVLVLMQNALHSIRVEFQILGDSVNRLASGRFFGPGGSASVFTGDTAEFEAELKKRREIEEKHNEAITASKKKESDLQIAIRKNTFKEEGTIDQASKKRVTAAIERDLESLGKLRQERKKLEEDFAKDREAFEKRQEIAEVKNGSLKRNRLNDEFRKAEEARFKLLKDFRERGKRAEETDELAPFIAKAKERAEAEKKFNNDRLDALRDAFRERIEVETQTVERIVALQNEARERGQISEQRAVENINQSREALRDALVDIQETFVTESRKLTEADPATIRKFESDVRRRVLDIQGKLAVDIINEEKKLQDLRNRLNEERLKAERERTAENIEFIIQIQREAVDVGLKLRSEAIQTEIKLEQEKLALTLDLISQELNARKNSDEARQDAAIKTQKAILETEKRTVVLQLEFIKARFAEEEKIRETRLARFKTEQAFFQRLANVQAEQALLQSERFVANQTELESQRLTLQEELIENQFKLNAVKEEQLAIEKEIDKVRQGIARGTATPEEQLAFANANRLLEERSDLYRQIQIRVQELNGELEIQNLLIRQSQEEERNRQRVTFNLLGTLFGQVRTKPTVTAAPIPVARPTLKFDEEGRVITTELSETLKLVTIAANPLRDVFRQLTVGGKETQSALGNLVNSISNLINQLISAFSESGLSGGGAIAGFVGSLIQGPIGAVLQIGGVIAQTVSSIFTRLSRKIAEDINESVEKILKNLERGTLKLGDALLELENKRIEAIRRLSGKKGGQKQLDELLPQLEENIFNLQKQQRDIQKSFKEELDSLRLGNDALRDFADSWDEVNDRVQEYLDSFSEANRTAEVQTQAIEFLSRSLGKLRADFLEELGELEGEAIDAALELNDLFEDRKKLLDEINNAQKEFNRQVFELTTADALEIRQPGVLERASRIAALREEFNLAQQERTTRLNALNREIITKAKQIDQYKTIFTISSDTAKLEARKNLLNEQSLERQIAKYKEIQDIVNSIIQTPEGNFTLSPGLQNQIGSRVTNVNFGAPNISVNVNVTGGAENIDPRTIGRQIWEGVLNESVRLGFNNS